MSIEEISLLFSMGFIIITFLMAVYSLILQKTDLKLQRREVSSQNEQIIALLTKIEKHLRK